MRLNKEFAKFYSNMRAKFFSMCLTSLIVPYYSEDNCHEGNDRTYKATYCRDGFPVLRRRAFTANILTDG